MPKFIVPEVDEKGYTDEQLRRIKLRHDAQYGKLPYPDAVPGPPLTKRNPSTVDKLWANKWNLVRHFVISGGGAALSTFTLTKDLTATGGAFVIGGILGTVRKGNDDLLRSRGKPDLLTAAKNRITRTKGVDMSASDYNKAEVVAFGHTIGDLINGARDGVSADDLGAFIAAVTAGAQTVNEMKDVPAAAGSHAIGAIADRVGDRFLADAIAGDEVTT